MDGFISPVDEETPIEHVLSLDVASNMKRSEVGIVLEGIDIILIKQALQFEFTGNNNQAEYEALIVGMVLPLKIGNFIMKAKIHS